MHVIARLYWIRTNVSSIAASALTTKLNARNGGHDLLFAVMHLWMAEIPRLELRSDFHRDGLAIRFLTNSEQISRNHFLQILPFLHPFGIGSIFKIDLLSLVKSLQIHILPY